MEVQQDFKELIELFNKHNVNYMIVGGYALAFHGAPRYTGVRTKPTFSPHKFTPVTQAFAACKINCLSVSVP